MSCVPANSAERDCMWDYSAWGYFEEEDERRWFKYLKNIYEVPRIPQQSFQINPFKRLD